VLLVVVDSGWYVVGLVCRWVGMSLVDAVVVVVVVTVSNKYKKKHVKNIPRAQETLLTSLGPFLSSSSSVTSPSSRHRPSSRLNAVYPPCCPSSRRHPWSRRRRRRRSSRPCRCPSYRRRQSFIVVPARNSGGCGSQLMVVAAVKTGKSSFIAYGCCSCSKYLKLVSI
jgi:hypothetical protein